MKILILHNLFAPYARGGAETVVRLAAEELSASGYEVRIWTTKPYFSRLPDDRESPNYRIHYHGSLFYNLANLAWPIRLFWHLADLIDIRAYFSLIRIIKDFAPDAIWAHNLKGLGFLTPLAIKRKKILHIQFFHDIQLLHPSGLMFWGRENILNIPAARLYQSAGRFLFGSPDFVVSPSAWLLLEHVQRGFFPRSNRLVMPNPVFIRHDQVAAENSIQAGACQIDRERKFRLLFAGQIEAHKGADMLMAAVRGLPPADYSLTFAGGGSLSAQLEGQAEEVENIKFCGRLGQEELAAEMQEADLLVVPSVCYENSPSIIGEAFAAGLPVLAADIGGCGELLQDGAGLTFQPASLEDLREKIIFARDHPEALAGWRAKGLEMAQGMNVRKYVEKITNLRL